MSYLKQSFINTIVIAKFFQLSQTDSIGMWEGAVCNFFAPKIGRQRVVLALTTATENDYLDTYLDEDGDTWYKITPEGYDLLEEMYLAKNSKIRDLIDSDFSIFLVDAESVDGVAAQDSSDVPASDRFVAIGDNSAGYSEVMATLEGATESIRGSNSLPAEDRSWIKIHLDLGIELLRKGGRTLRSALSALIVEPLKAALREVSEDNIKIIVRAALEALKTFFGIF